MGGTRRRFTREFKLEAVRLVNEGNESVTTVAERLGIRPDMLRNWKRQVAGLPRAQKNNIFMGQGKATGQEEELKRLRREVEARGSETEVAGSIGDGGERLRVSCQRHRRVGNSAGTAIGHDAGEGVVGRRTAVVQIRCHTKMVAGRASVAELHQE